MPTTPEFDRLYAQLNARQKEAVDAVEGPVMVVAGPGTGKTNILTLRIANILARTDTEPEAVLALTYTVNAAAEMQRRLARIVGGPAYRVTITTFHGLCEQVIRDHEERFTDLAGWRIAEDGDRLRVMERLFASAAYLDKLSSFGPDQYYVKPALRAIEELKREGVGPDRLAALVAAQRDAIANDPASVSTRGPTKGKLKADALAKLERMDRLDELVPLYREYLAALAADGFYEYSDMLTRVRDALEADEQLRLALQERYQYVLVDEHQDTNAVQNRIVELLAGFFDRPNLFIVGDEKQAIYRFQGASLDNFLYFRDRFREVRLIVLTENYRSSQLILDAAHGVRASREPLQARAERTPAPVALCAASSPDAQYFAVGELIRRRLSAGAAPERIAVLYRRNADGADLAGMLARMGIPHALEGQLDVLEDPDIGRLMLLLEAVREYGSPGPLLAALHVPWLGIPPLDVYKLAAFCGRTRNPYDVIASMKLMGEAHLAAPEVAVRWSGRMAGWSALARQEDPSHALEVIVQESGCLDALVAHPEGRAKLTRLHALYDTARNLVRGHRQATLHDLVDQLRYVRDKGIRLEVSAPPLPGRVRLMTAHGAKGLEFDTVFLVDCYEKHWPSPGRTSPLELPPAVYRLRDGTPPAETEDDAEERNLFFVALTRARHEAVVCWPQRDRRGNELQPTRYLELIRPELTATPDTADLEEAYAAAAQVRLAPPPAAVPELADRAYLRELFVRRGLSPTHLNNYLECPWKYFYRNLVRIPEADSPVLMYGNAVDRALQLFFDRRMAGESPGAGDLIALFERTAHDQPFTERDLAAALDRGRAALAGWYEQWHAQWPARSMHQVVINGIAVPGREEVTLNGKLDKMELLQGSAVRVVDYKTGKPKSRNQIAGATKGSDGNYLRQLTFYRLLLDRWQDGRYAMQDGVIDFIDPDAQGRYRKEAFAITREQSDALLEQVTGVVDDILNLRFWGRTCGDADCPYCRLRSLQ